MPSASPFISRDDLTDYLGRDVTNDDGAIIVLDAACDIVRDVMEQTINRVVGDTVTLNGGGTDVLTLPELPVSQAGTVLVDGTAVTDYTLAEGGLLYRGTIGATSTASTWPLGRQNVQVTYDHGYADADIPRSVRFVALGLASRMLVQGVATEESVGDVRVKYGGAATDLTVGERLVLEKHRRHT